MWGLTTSQLAITAAGRGSNTPKNPGLLLGSDAHQTPAPTSVKPLLVPCLSPGQGGFDQIRVSPRTAPLSGRANFAVDRSTLPATFHIRSKSHNSKAANRASPILGARIGLWGLYGEAAGNKGKKTWLLLSWLAIDGGGVSWAGCLAHEQSGQNNAYTTQHSSSSSSSRRPYGTLQNSLSSLQEKRSDKNIWHLNVSRIKFPPVLGPSCLVGNNKCGRADGSSATRLISIEFQHSLLLPHVTICQRNNKGG